MKNTKMVKEAYAFLLLTLTFSYFVFWGPLALFKFPTISFVSDTKGPAWAIGLYLAGGFVPSLLAIFLTWKMEGVSGLRLLGRRIFQFKLGCRCSFDLETSDVEQIVENIRRYRFSANHVS